MNTSGIEVYDTTLRDGTQAAGLSPSVDDKLKVARLLEELGVDYIEGGWPGANPKDNEFFRRARAELALERSILVAFGSTCRPHGSAPDDPQLHHLLETGTEAVCIVGKSWNVHVTEALRVDLAEGLRIVTDSVEFLRSEGRRVFFDAEHFFDGYREDPSFALSVLDGALAAGAERLVLCDTNGGTLPDEAERVVREVQTFLPDAVLGVHFHDDGGCAVANSLAGVRAGARQVQGCMNGYGERTGNADLCSLVPNLVLKIGVEVRLGDRLTKLTPIAHHIAEIMNVPIEASHPYVGSSAFAHKAGLHTSALARFAGAYEHIDPSLVGNSARMLVSELMGRSTVLSVAKHLGWDVDPTMAQAVVDRVKNLEHRGYYFEAADGSFELLVREAMGWEQGFFQVESFRVAISQHGEQAARAEATVELTVGEDRVSATRNGDGPVHALDRALRAALAGRYPHIEAIRLTDYRVKDLDALDGTAARVRVLIECSDAESTWGTVGVHHNIIEASWEALVDGIVVGLLRHEARAEDDGSRPVMVTASSNEEAPA
jgi:2-isopropylmalate synthase